VNFAPRDLAVQVNRTGTDFPPDVDELTAAGLTAEPSRLVRPVRVAESPVALECVLAGEHSFRDERDRGSTVVFGRVVHLSVSRRVLAADGLPDVQALHPASRLGRDQWAALGEVFELARAPYEPPTA
jgi:flavin reductase (DIM6/NTAB) family NADH-FMN oxidoreductase RutF